MGDELVKVLRVYPLISAFTSVTCQQRPPPLSSLYSTPSTPTMPGITETLDRIAHEADQIKAHAKRSERPTGPITSAVLYLPHPYRPHPSILSLIREATPAERRPFDVYALEELSGASGSTSGQRRDGDGRSYQRLEPHQLTPLRNLPAQKGTPEELKATLHAADEVINMLADGFHPMRRARKQVSDYIAQHDQNTARIAQLQERLDALSASRPEKKAAEEETPTPARSIDEAIAAEEEALRALEASIAPLRRTAAAKAEATRSPPPKASPSRVINSPVSTSKSSAAPTPRKPPVPSPPRFTHTTPKRPVAETPVNNRFTPLHLYTPRTTQRPSSLAPPGSTIVDRVRGSITPAQASAYRNRTLPSSAKPPSDPTPARPTHVLEPEPPTPSDSYISKEDSTPLAKSGPKTVEGVEVDLPYVIAATVSPHCNLSPSQPSTKHSERYFKCASQGNRWRTPPLPQCKSICNTLTPAHIS